MDAFAIGTVAALVALSVWISVRHAARQERITALIRQLDAELNPIFRVYSNGDRALISEINGRRGSRRAWVLAVAHDRIAVYDVGRQTETLLSFRPADLRWFGRPRKYSSGANELWMHAEIDHRWVLARFRLSRDQTQALVRALKVVATPEQITAYRRRRPYIHYGPVTARPATQDMRGAWSLDDPLDLYLMPLCLVALRGTTVACTIPLHTLQKVAAIRRIDRPRAAGLVRFEGERAGERQPFAFAVDDHEAFAAALAEAARRTLEDPLDTLRKKKKLDDGEE